MRRLPGRYTLFTHIPVHVDGDRVLTDPLWARDLVGHLPYIERFQLCCPIEPLDSAATPPVAVPGLAPDQILPIRRDRGHLSILANLVPNFLGVARAVRRSEIVHAGGAGWAFPYAFYILPLSYVMRFDWVMVIESSFWMKPASGRVTPRQWLRHHVYRLLLGAALDRATARIFTTDGYRRFFAIPRDGSLIAPAVWFDPEDVISEADHAERLARREADRPRLVFPARLVPEKGTDTVLAAVTALERLLPADVAGLDLDIVGTGPDAAACAAFAAAHRGRVRVTLRSPVDYGAPFFALLRDYDAILVANRHHEQPRIVFDGFAQGLPVISTATEGVREIVRDGDNALLCEIDDARALAARIARFAADRGLRRRLSDNARAAARGWSHEAMHRTRHAFLSRTIAAAAPPPPPTDGAAPLLQNSSS